MRGFVGGFLALMLFDTVLTSDTATQRAGGALVGAAGVFRRFVDPTVPLIPPRRP